MIGQIIGSIGSLATAWVDGKTAVQKANAEIKLKQATGEIDWELEAIRSAQNSWKDEYLVGLFSIPLILVFTGEKGREIVAEGFIALESMPEWYQYTLGVIVASSFAVRSATKFFRR